MVEACGVQDGKLRDIRPVLIIYPTIYSLLILNYLVRQKDLKLAGVILSIAHIKAKGVSFSFPESSYILLRKTGLRYSTYLLFTIKCAYVFIFFWRFTGIFSGKRVRLKTFLKIFKEYGIPVHKSENINGEQAVGFMKSVKANLIVSIYNNQILKYRTCKKFDYGAIGVHNSYLPDLGGLDAAFEGLFHGLTETGTTAHFIDTGIDTGDIIHQEKVPVAPKDTVFSLNLRQWLKGAQIIPLVLEQLKSGSIQSKKQDLTAIRYPYRSFPDKSRVRSFHQKRKRCIWWKEIFVPIDFVCEIFKGEMN